VYKGDGEDEGAWRLYEAKEESERSQNRRKHAFVDMSKERGEKRK